ncbi:MAG TPA: ABC transporter substrate-binding protein [Alphaproteobacteria bacterium]|nr:ABC transporter substrate-binding protein [Alphaproteobacteria bacterium]
MRTTGATKVAAAWVSSAVIATALWLLPVGLPWEQASAADRVVTDSAGREVKIPPKVDRVFVAGPPAAVVVYTLAPEKLVGWTAPLSDEKKALMPKEYAALPVVGRLTGSNGNAIIDEVAARHPDIILDVGDVDARYFALADRVQERTGVPYILMDGRLTKTAKLYRQLGDILGATAKAAELASYADETLADLKLVLSAIPPDHRPRIFYARNPDATQSAAVGSIIGEIFDTVGALNVAGETKDAITPDQVHAWQPDVIVTSNVEFGRSALTDPRWQGLTAVRDGRVYRAPLDPFGWVDEPPSVNRLIGIKWLIAVLYPGSSKIDMRQMARDFYARFYHVQLTEKQLDGVLDAAH